MAPVFATLDPTERAESLQLLQADRGVSLCLADLTPRAILEGGVAADRETCKRWRAIDLPVRIRRPFSGVLPSEKGFACIAALAPEMGAPEARLQPS